MYRHQTFVLYLATNEQIRSQGYGSMILDEVKQMTGGKECVLHIEALDENAENYEQRIRRKHFYEKNGFHSTGYMYKESDVEYEVLSTGAFDMFI